MSTVTTTRIQYTHVEAIRLYMDSHYMEDITLEKLSKEFFLERSKYFPFIFQNTII